MLARYLPFPPQPDESARGLIVRVAENNLCTSSQMCEWLGLPRIDKDFDVDPAPAAAIIGIKPEKLASLGFGSNGAEAMLGNQVSREVVERQAMRVCPKCLASAPYHRRIWDHQQLQVCPLHGVRLLRRCPSCAVGGRIRWGRSFLLQGDCGHNLGEQEAETVQSCIGAAAAYQSCGLVCEGLELSPEFRSLSLQPLLDLLFFLGRLEVVVAQGNPDNIQPSSMTIDERLLETGAAIAVGWPESFDQLATRVRAAYPNAVGIAKQYDHLHRFVRKSGGKEYEHLLKTAYAKHLSGRADISGAAWPDFLKRPAKISVGIYLHEAMKLLGLGHRSFASLRRQPLWTDLTPLPMAKEGIQYRRDDILALKAKLDRLVPPHAVDEILGLGRGRGRSLVDAGLMPFHLWSRHNKRGEQRTVDIRDIDRFARSVRRHSLPSQPPRPTRFSVVLNKAAARRVVPFTDVVLAILSGELQGYISDDKIPLFASLLFDNNNVTCVLDRLVHLPVAGRCA